MKTILGVIALIILVGFILTAKIESGKDSIKKWAQKNQYEVVDIETHMTVFGTPYNWLNKGQNIFEVDIKTKEGKSEKWWIRTGVFSDDYEKENK
jgi:glucose uptake protein GlcU